MKVIHKYFVIALLLSLIFSVSAVAAHDIQENMTFEQSSLADVSDETISTSLEETQEINEVEKDSSLSQGEDNKHEIEASLEDSQEIQTVEEESLLGHSGDDDLSVGEQLKFSDLQTQINNADSKSIIYLGNNTYIADTTNSIIINKEITIRGGLKLDDGKYSILDGRGMTTIFKVTSSNNMVFDSIIFLNGFSNTDGGAFFVDRGGSYTYEFRNCKFINNIAHNGAAIYAHYSSSSSSNCCPLNIINSTFINNKAINGEGGAIYDGNYYQLRIENSNFINNTAKTRGGAVSTRHYKPTFISSNFINNSATDEGGAIYTYQNQFDISYCYFINNSANYAGAYYSYSASGSTNNNHAQIRSSNFINNKAHFKGGAVMWNVLSGQIIDSQFTNNSADGEGGAIYVQPVNNVYSPYTFKIINSRFIENSASFGGAVYVRGIYYTTHGSASAPSSTNNQYYERTEILSSHFISNTANKGGAIYDSGLKTYISSNQFTNNDASEDDSNALFMTIDDQFEYEPFKTNARYYTGFDKRLSGNIINGEKTEIVLDKSTFGLVNLKILDINSQSYSKEVTYYDGKVRLYATLKTKDGNYKVSVNTDFNFTVGDTVYPINFKDGYAEIQHDAEIGSSIVKITPADPHYYNYIRWYTIQNGQIVYDVDDYEKPVTTNKDLTYYKDYELQVTLNVLKSDYYIDFNDSEGEINGFIEVPFSVKDASDNPVDGTVTVIYNSITTSASVTNGKGKAFVTLPDEETTFDLTIRYANIEQTRKVNVIDYSTLEPTTVIINIPENVTGHVLGAVTIPVEVTDGDGRPLNGEISVTYKNVQKFERVVNGNADFSISLPDAVQSFYVIVSMYGENKVCKVNVVDNSVPIEEEKDIVVIEMPSKMVGHVGKQIIVPIYIHNGNNTPLNGHVTVYAVGGEHIETLQNGRTDFVFNLPNRKMEFDVIVVYNQTRETVKIRVIENTSTEPTDDNEVIIELDDISAPTGSNIHIPVYIYDLFGTRLDGEITFSYLGYSDKADLINGRSTVTVGLPTHSTTFVFTVNYEGVVKQIFINVVDAKNPLGNMSQVESKEKGQVVITLPKDAQGTVIVTIGGKNYSGIVENGEAIINIDDLPDGEYDATIHYSGDDTYSPVDKPIKVTIKDSDSSNPTDPLADVTKVTSGGDGKVVIPFPEDATGAVQVTINGKPYLAEVSDGKAVLDTHELPEGDYDATVKYYGDQKYPASEKNIPVTIKHDAQGDTSNPMGDITQITSGDDGKVVIPFPSDATGAVQATINGKNYLTSVADGKAVLDTSDLPAGTYDATIKYFGDKKYSASEKNLPVTIKEAHAVDPSNPMGDITEVKSGNDGKIEIPFPSDATGVVVVNINGKDYNAPVEGGKAVIDANDVPAGTYEATVKYSGDTKYSSSEKTVTIIKEAAADPTNPMRDVTEISSGDDGKVVIPFPSDATGSVKVTINGKDYYGQIVDGKVVLDTTDIPSGEYDATVHYYGDNKYSPSEKTVPVTIDNPQYVDPTNPIGNVNEVTSDNDGKVEIPFPDDATGVVVVNINGKDYPASIVDGKVVLDTSNLPVGNYTAVVHYYGDTKYSASEKNVTVIIKEPSKDASVVDPTNPINNVNDVTSSDDGKVEIPFHKDATGQVVVNINGKDYPASIVDGKIVFDSKDVPQGNYNATVKYLGDDKYPASEKTVTMVIKEYHSSTTNNIVKPAATKKATKITAAKKTFKKSVKVKKYSITLKSGKTPLKKVQVTIKVGKKTYKAKTNAKGKATFKINKLTKKGKYTAVIKFKGDKTYKAATKKVKITIK